MSLLSACSSLRLRLHKKLIEKQNKKKQNKKTYNHLISFHSGRKKECGHVAYQQPIAFSGCHVKIKFAAATRGGNSGASCHFFTDLAPSLSLCQLPASLTCSLTSLISYSSITLMWNLLLVRGVGVFRYSISSNFKEAPLEILLIVGAVRLWEGESFYSARYLRFLK